MEREIKVYKMNDCEWMAAASPLEAAIGYAKNMSMSLERVVKDELIDVKDGCPRELSKSEMRRLKYHDEENDVPVVRTFHAQLDRMIEAAVEFPAYFASTEF